VKIELHAGKSERKKGYVKQGGKIKILLVTE